MQFPSNDDFSAIKDLRHEYARAYAGTSQRANADTQTIDSLLAAARNAQGAVASFHADGSVRHVHNQPAAAVGHLDMRSLNISPLIDLPKDARATASPIGTAAAATNTFSDVVIANSRVIQAGAHAVFLAEPVGIPLPNGETGFQEERTRLDVIRPSTFALLADGADATETPLPVDTAHADRATFGIYAAAHRLTRRERLELSEGRLAATATLALSLGVSRILDGILLNALTASNPDDFALGAAAAQGLVLSDLAAICGTDGNGAMIDTNGNLRCNGIAATMTDTIDGSIIAAFSRFGFAIDPALTLSLTRTNTQSDLDMVAFVHAAPLIPSAANCWVA